MGTLAAEKASWYLTGEPTRSGLGCGRGLPHPGPGASSLGTGVCSMAPGGRHQAFSWCPQGPEGARYPSTALYLTTALGAPSFRALPRARLPKWTTNQ
jgi:hypothetical protein